MIRRPFAGTSLLIVVVVAGLALGSSMTSAQSRTETVARFYTKVNTKKPLEKAVANDRRPTTLDEALAGVQDYDFMFGAIDPSGASALKARRSGAVIALYELPAGRSSGEADVKSHEEWFMHSANGERIRNENGVFLMDMGNPQFRAYEIDFIVRNVAAGPYDGIYLDVIQPQWIVGAKDFAPAIPPASVQAWPGNMLTFLQTLRSRLPAGKKIWWNSLMREKALGDRWASWENQALTVAEGVQADGFCRNRRKGLAEEDFAYQLRRYASVGAQGKMMLMKSAVKEKQGPLEAGELDKTEVLCFATYMLIADGKNIMYYPAHELNRGKVQGVGIYEANLGQPVGAYTQSGALYRRDFARGLVLVNPTGAPASVSLGTAMVSAADRRQYTTASLEPHSGLILLKP